VPKSQDIRSYAGIPWNEIRAIDGIPAGEIRSIDPPIHLLSPRELLGSTVLRQWFDLRYGVGVGYTLNGADISQLTDLSGNAKHETQGTASLQPAFAATAGPNSTPTLQPAAAANEYVRCTTEIVAAASRPTFLILARIDNDPGQIFDYRNGFITFYRTGGNFVSYFDFTTSADESDALTVPATSSAYGLIEMSYTSPASTKYNGVACVAQPSTDDTAPQIINSNSGAASVANGDLCSKLTLSRALTADERFSIHDWFNRSVVNGYSYGLSLPTS